MKEELQSHVHLTEEVYQLLRGTARKIEVPKNQTLFFPPRVIRKCLFVEKGLLRGYKIIDGKEYTHHFYSEKWFATDFESFLTGKPGTIFIESLTEVQAYEFDKADLHRLYETHHSLEKLGRIMAEKAFLATVEKLADIQTLDLKDRYQSLIRKNPQLFLEVPQKYIASYLGVSEQSLSRIKKSLIS